MSFAKSQDTLDAISKGNALPLVSMNIKTDLRKKYESLNPIELKEKLDNKIKEFRSRLALLKEERGDHLRNFDWTSFLTGRLSNQSI